MKACERIPHHHVVGAAVKHGYCLWALRLSLAPYRGKRVLSLGGAFSRSVYVTQGFTAGAGHAEAEDARGLVVRVPLDQL